MTEVTISMPVWLYQDVLKPAGVIADSVDVGLTRKWALITASASYLIYLADKVNNILAEVATLDERTQVALSNLVDEVRTRTASRGQELFSAWRDEVYFWEHSMADDTAEQAAYEAWTDFAHDLHLCYTCGKRLSPEANNYCDEHAD